MNFLKRLAGLFGGGGAPRSDKRYLTVYALSRRCNEPVSGQVDLLNSLSKQDDSEYAYYTRKVLHTTGEHRCFAQIEINLYFNADKQIAHHEVEGGRWLTSEEYTVELARFNTPPPEAEPENEDNMEESVPSPTASKPTPSTPKEDDHA